MEIEFQDSELERLAFEASYVIEPLALMKGYRKRINQIIQVPNRQALYAYKSLRLEKLIGRRKGKHSMRINNQYRLIIEFRQKNKHEKVVIINIEDYH